MFNWDDGRAGEDCLRVNVWTSGINDGGKRPVMVWFHGGGYTYGSGQEEMSYDGENLSRSGDVVVVTVNHRLGVLGFLNLAEFGSEFAASANVGLLDLVAALEWIRDNVEGYRRLIEAGGVDVIQLDPGRCHGVTGCVRAIKLVEAANLKFSAHTWSSALNTAASVHLLAASRAGLCLDFKRHESPMQHELVSDPWVQKNGLIAVRDKPGLGVTVREDVVRKYQFG